MTKTEAITILERTKRCMDINEVIEALDLALTALRGPTREIVERMRGEWREEIVKKCNWKGKKQSYYQPHSCSKCHTPDPGSGTSKFCPACGAPMTDEAVQMVIERMEALHENRD